MSFMEFKEVWERRGDSQMSLPLFGLLTLIFTVFGTFTAFASAFLFKGVDLDNGWILWPTFIIVLVAGIAGVVIAKKSNNWIVSMFGFMLITIPYGTLLGPYLGMYDALNIIQAFVYSILYVGFFGTIGFLIPRSLEGWLKGLVSGLMIAILLYIILGLAVSLFGWSDAIMNYLDVAVIILFAFIIMYDFNRAARIPRTLDNSVDVAIAVYLDFINVFIRFLGLGGNNE